jgi:hypothetical protein
MFIYQFTGSFMTNIAEYVIWVLAYTPAFREFDKNKLIEPVIKKYKQPLENINAFTS